MQLLCNYAQVIIGYNGYRPAHKNAYLHLHYIQRYYNLSSNYLIELYNKLTSNHYQPTKNYWHISIDL